MTPAPPLPKPLTDPAKLEELTELLVPGGVPQALSGRPAAMAVPCECFVNVPRLIAESAGDQVCGWSLFEFIPGVLIEAEFHAIHRAPDGALRDPTPKEFPLLEPVTVFLADPSLTYEGQQVDNVRVALADDQLVRSFIRTRERKFEILNRGELAQQHGEIAVSPEFERILGQEQRFLGRIYARYFPAEASSVGDPLRDEHDIR